jgi:tetratricopeptide (TPR) repeat protein/predicted Ser/Thr protein kinase
VACPDDNVLVAMVARSLPPEQFAALEVHIDSCENCRQIVAAAIADTHFAVGTPAEPKPADELEALERIVDVSFNERYVVDSILGRGGMGTVYLARDITLDREVALKVHRTGGSSDRLHREAMAMAKLAHPNVVTVYEVASVDDRIYVAMEYVKGETLRGWRGAAARSWRDVVAMMLEVGQGVAAAHAAGLVHRDFKPENVLVGDDGRPRVGDFGLARAGASPSSEGAISKSTPLDARMTATGALLGTPAYMAPEQLTTSIVDARCDQFAFYVVAWELLYGKRPFSGSTLAALEESITAARPWLPARTDVPSRVRAVLERGLAVAADDRYPDMPALLRALRIAARPRTRRRVAFAAGALVVLGATAVFAHGQLSERRHAATCAAAGDHVRGLLDPITRARMRLAFIATGSVDAEGSFERTEKVLDRTGDALAVQATALCRGRDEPRAITDARARCLADQERDHSWFITALTSADRHLVRASTNAAWARYEPAPCDDVQRLLSHAQTASTTPPEIAAQIEKGYNLELVAKFDEALAIAKPVVESARARKDSNAELEGLLLLGRLYKERQDREHMPETYERAISLAEATGRDVDAAIAYTALATYYGVLTNDYAKAHRSIDLARAKLLRLGTNNPAIDGELAFVEGQVLFEENRLGEAEVAMRKSIATMEDAYGPEHPKLGPTYGTLSQILRFEHKPEDALAAARRTLEVMTASYGPLDPGTAGAELNLAQNLADAGNYAEASERYRRADEGFTRALGPDYPYVGAITANLAEIALGRKDYAEAEAGFRRAVAIIERQQGPDSLDASAARADVARALATSGRYADALAEQQRVLAIVERNGENGEPRLAGRLIDLGNYQLVLHDARGAFASAERALRVLAKRPADANPAEIGEAKFLLARALWDRSSAPADHARALQLASEAKSAPMSEEVLAKLDQWLAKHPR